jgi:Peptidase family S41/N-terminal domain of Peptidase_S41 in eukaryotic IRBP
MDSRILGSHKRTSCSLILTVCWFLILFNVLPSVAQEVAPPETPAGQALASWLEAFNSADETLPKAYIEKYQPTGPVGLQMSFRQRTGGLDLTSIHISEPLHIEFLVKERASDTRGIGELMLSGSHPPRITGFAFLAIPPGDPPVLGFSIDAQTRARVIDHAIEQLQDSYVSPELAKQMGEALRHHQKHGDYNAITDGLELAQLLTTHLGDVSHDKHLTVRFVPTRLPDSLDGPPDAQQLARNQRMMQRSNCAFDKVEVLPNNIGYVKFNAFNRPNDCGQTAIAAMGFIANTEALIFDLRENGGGDPAMIALICSYLFDRPTHLNDLWNRKANFTTQWWTLPYVPGKLLPNIPVYVLTSSRTFSGAEEFSYDLQSLKRATIVGEVTGGGAHPVSGQRIDDRFIIVVPIAKAINPVTKTNWEGTGVKPDVAVAASDALTTAQKLASEKLMSQQH